MMRVFRAAGYSVERNSEEGIFTITLPTEETDETAAVVAAAIDEFARLSRRGMIVAGDPSISQTTGSLWNQLGRFRLGGLG